MATDEVMLDVHRSLGTIEGRMQAADGERAEMKTMLKEQGEQLGKIVRHLERERGSRRVWRTVGAGIAAVVSGAVSLGVTLWTSRHG